MYFIYGINLCSYVCELCHCILVFVLVLPEHEI